MRFSPQPREVAWKRDAPMVTHCIIVRARGALCGETSLLKNKQFFYLLFLFRFGIFITVFIWHMSVAY